MGTCRFGTKIELKIMDIDKEYFNDKSEAEKLRNVSSLVNDIVNAKPEETLEVQEGEKSETEELPEVMGSQIQSQSLDSRQETSASEVAVGNSTAIYSLAHNPISSCFWAI